MVSHIWPYKNVLQLIEGFVLAQARMSAPFTLLLAGRFFVPSYEQLVLNLLSTLDPDGTRVVLLGHVEHAASQELLEGATGFVFSSTCENCPTALIEALVAGSAIACSNVGVMPEIAGQAAIYFDPDDVASVADALARLMSEPDLRRDLRDRARARAVEFPDQRAVAEQTLRVLESASRTGTA